MAKRVKSEGWKRRRARKRKKRREDRARQMLGQMDGLVNSDAATRIRLMPLRMTLTGRASRGA